VTFHKPNLSKSKAKFLKATLCHCHEARASTRLRATLYYDEKVHWSIMKFWKRHGYLRQLEGCWRRWKDKIIPQEVLTDCRKVFWTTSQIEIYHQTSPTREF